jgi:hypothetical protein
MVVMQELMDSENITACLPRQLNRRATENHASKPEVVIDSENKEVCVYLVYGFQDAIRRFTLCERRVQMNRMALRLFLRIIEKASAQIPLILFQYFREVS